jgi:magnesium-transporting ATPase (P-type)
VVAVLYGVWGELSEALTAIFVILVCILLEICIEYKAKSALNNLKSVLHICSLALTLWFVQFCVVPSFGICNSWRCLIASVSGDSRSWRHRAHRGQTLDCLMPAELSARQAGEQIAADGRLLVAIALDTQEAALTGDPLALFVFLVLGIHWCSCRRRRADSQNCRCRTRC